MKRKKIEKLADIISEKVKDELYLIKKEQAVEDYTTNAESETFNKFEKIINNLLNNILNNNFVFSFLFFSTVSFSSNPKTSLFKFFMLISLLFNSSFKILILLVFYC